MGVEVNKTSAVTPKIETKKETVLTKTDNKAVENQTEVASKAASEAICSIGKSLISKPSAPKMSEEDSSFVADLKKKYIVDTGNPEKDAKTNRGATVAFEKMLTGTSEVVSERLQKYRAVTEKDSDVSPMDFIHAQADLTDLKSRGLEELTGKEETEQLTKLSKARHLLGGSYPVDFAVEMVDLDATFKEYVDLGMQDGVATASRDTRVSDNQKAGEFGLRESADVKRMASLAAQAYTPAGKIKPERLDGYEVIGSSTKDNGFAGTAFRAKDGSIVIAYRGSDDVSDMRSDLQMVNGTKLPEQFYDAQQFYEDIRSQNPDAKIVVTGHSLGGALSQLVAAHNEDSFAVAFNAPGTKDIIDRESGLTDSGNIYNILVDGDIISGTLAQPGQTQLIDVRTDRYGNKMHPHAIGNCM